MKLFRETAVSRLLDYADRYDCAMNSAYRVKENSGS